jgi:predicted Rossmann fold nucleotide-binding protein DprA/Smf involved in DNA uptake
MNKIIEKGLVLTEYPPNTEPMGKHFPVRNRIMTGLAQAVVVVEADNRSGSLITARLALAEGRDVYAVPGNIDSHQSRGTNGLIKSGAGLVTGAYDILSEYEHIYSHKINIENSKYFRNMSVNKRQKKIAEKSGDKESAENGGIKIKKEDITVVEVNLQNKDKDLNVEEKLSKMNVSLNETELEVYKFFYDRKDEKIHPNDITIPNISKPDILNTLTFLELYGLLMSHPGDYYSVEN